MKYIIVQLSGKQFLFEENLWYDINYIKRNKKDFFISLEKLVLYKNNFKFQIGKPFLLNSYISAYIISDILSKKLIVTKLKIKKNYTRMKGHRQKYTRILLYNKFN